MNQATKKRTIRISRDDIVNVSATIFAERGYWASNLRDIAEQLDITAAAIYYHFNKKEGILKDIIFKGLDEICLEVKNATLLNLAPRETLEKMVGAHLTWCMANPNGTKIISEDSRFLQPVDYEMSTVKQKEILDLYKVALKNYIPADRLTQYDLNITAFNIIAVVLGWYRWYRYGADTDPVEVLDRCVSFAVNGIGYHPS